MGKAIDTPEWGEFVKKLPVFVAVRWNHLAIIGDQIDPIDHRKFKGVPKFCFKCGNAMDNHGVFGINVGNKFVEFPASQVVCPGDWLVDGDRGGKVVLTDKDFHKMYEPVEKPDDHGPGSPRMRMIIDTMADIFEPLKVGLYQEGQGEHRENEES